MRYLASDTVKYTSPSVRSLLVKMDKERTGRLARSAKLPTGLYILLALISFVFSRASRMLRVATEVVQDAVCLCVCVCGIFFPKKRLEETTF